MNEYRILLVDRDGNNQEDHVTANSAQEAADAIRRDWKSCYILRISMTVNDWK